MLACLPILFYLDYTIAQIKRSLIMDVDKSKLYMRFTLIYLVFCIVYHLFWYFYVCFYLVGDVQVEGSKNEQSEAKKSQKRRF